MKILINSQNPKKDQILSEVLPKNAIKSEITVCI